MWTGRGLTLGLVGHMRSFHHHCLSTAAFVNHGLSVSFLLLHTIINPGYRDTTPTLITKWETLLGVVMAVRELSFYQESAINLDRFRSNSIIGEGGRVPWKISYFFLSFDLVAFVRSSNKI